jgi:cysteine desulfurase family protein
MKKDIIYLDNAATSWPKPACVAEAMTRFLSETGANPGRAGHRMANESAGIVYDARERIARLFNCDDPLRVVFGANVTEALNLALRGLLRPGDHVITTSMEHNSMMRPLRALEQNGIAMTVVAASSAGETDPADIRRAFQKNTRLVAVNHASNVTGTIVPIAQIGAIVREHGALFLVDTAQSAGVLDIDMIAQHIDLAAFTGHKALYGPMGTGGLVIGERVDINEFQPLKRGGTGSRSSQELQPDFLPDVFESGTPNVVGLAGLTAALEWLENVGIKSIRYHEHELTKQLSERLADIGNVRILGPENPVLKTAIVSFCLKNMAVSEAAHVLDETFGIMCRAGLHCAPAAHRAIHTFPDGTIRFGIGYFNTKEQVDAAADALESIAGGKL